MEQEHIKSLIAQKLREARKLEIKQKNEGLKSMYERRLDHFITGSASYILLEPLEHAQVNSTLYHAYADRSAIAVSLTDDGLLWLDNESASTDFRTFFKLENLSNYILREPSDAADLITNLYMGPHFQAKLVQNYSDIPKLQETVESANWSSIIQPVSLTTIDDTSTLIFYVWTVKLGLLYKVQLTIEQEELVQIDAEFLSIAVGKFSIAL
jgi:hypothetical protein